MKGCLGIVLLFLALAAGEYWALRHTPMSGSIGLPVASAALIALTLANAWGLVLWFKRRSALGRAPTAWRDGDFVGFAGRIASERAPLTAPASGDACAIYEYALKRTVMRQSRSDGSTTIESSDGTAYNGMGMAGCKVQSGTFGYRLLGFPIITGAAKTRWSSPQARAQMAAHLLRSEVAPKPRHVGAAVRSLANVLADADGIVHFDEGSFAAFELDSFKETYRNDPARAQADLAEYLEQGDYWIEEALIPDGAEVTVFGAYRAADASIDVGSGMKHLERGLTLGNAATTAVRDITRSAIGLLVLSGISAALHYWVAPPLWASVTSTPYAGAGVSFDQAIGAAMGAKSSSSTLVTLAQSNDAPALRLLTRLGADPNHVGGSIMPIQQAGDLETVSALLDGKADPNFADDNGTTALHRFTERGDLDTVKLLLAHGAKVDAEDHWGNTALTRAAVYGHVEIGRALLAAEASTNHRAKDGATALDEARANGMQDFVALLLEHGARETEVTQDTGRAVTLGDAPVRLLQAYADALSAHDVATIAVLKPSVAGFDWSTTDWDALNSSRPARIERVAGFVGADRATIRVNGTTSDGKPRSLTIGFELTRDAGKADTGPLAAYAGWSIAREWIEWGELKH